MSNHFRIPLVMAAFFSYNQPGRHLHGGKPGTAWKEPPVADGSFFDVMFSADGSTVYAGVTRCLSVPGTEPATGGAGRDLCHYEVRWKLRSLCGLRTSPGS